jgi:hypothetical protein
MSYQTYILTFDSKDSARSGRSSLPENKIFDTEEELLRRLKEIHEGEFGPLNPGDATVEVNSMDLGDFDPEVPPEEADASAVLSRGAVLEEDLSRITDAQAR